MLSFQKACRSHFSLKIQLHYYYFLKIFSLISEFIVVIFSACSPLLRKCEKIKKKFCINLMKIVDWIAFVFFWLPCFHLRISLRAHFLHFRYFLNYTTIFFLTYHIIILIASYICLCSRCDWMKKMCFWGQGDFMEVEF